MRSLTTPLRRVPFGRRRRRGRAGVTLLEVLISIFVLAIGLLGVAAVIPVGRFQIVEAAKADRCGACGRAALRDLKVRGILDPTRWMYSDGTQVAWLQMPLPEGESFAIDPLMIARSTDNGIDVFPYAGGDPPNVMKRVTLALNNQAAQAAVFDRIFTWQDDLVIPVPDQASERPQQLFVSDGGGNALVPQCSGNYSWMVTVTPATNETGLWAGNRHLYSISVVVFYKRDFVFPPEPGEPAGERTVSVQFLGGGWGGGDVRLGSGNPADLDVKENEWLMLRATVPDARCQSGRGVFKWYRIAAVGEAGPDPTVRYATLAGPDWRIDNDSNGAPDDAYAAVCTGAIGVYTETIELDRDSLFWSR